MNYNLFFSSIAFIFLAVICGCSSGTDSSIEPAELYNAPPAYHYPINNPYAATVIGVPPSMRKDYKDLPLPKDKTLILFPDRPIPEGFWYAQGLQYSELLQSKPAPLVYIIAGTGADSHSSTMVIIADMLYSAGFSVVLLPSPTHPDFIINASANFLPGRPSQDARDIYNVIQHIDPQVEKEAHITHRMLIGYSLGAIDALFTDRLAPSAFSKVLLINPPLNLYSSMQTIDNLLYRALPNGINDADHFIKNTVQRLSYMQQSNDALDFSNSQLLIEAYTNYKFGDNRLATLIGINFRLAAVDMIFTADIMGHDGYIFPKNWEFTTETSSNDFLGVALRTSFKNYFDQLYTEKYHAYDPSLNAANLIAEGNLENMAPFISQHQEIGILTNKDDIILAPGEYEKLVNLFGNRAIVFPNGGHLGNLAYPAVAYSIVQFLKQ